MVKSILLYSLFVLGIIILLVSIAFRIQHWPGVLSIFWAGYTCQILFFLVIFWDMLSSKKASSVTKMSWVFIYAAILLFSLFIFPEFGAIVFFVLGGIYLAYARKQFFSGNRPEDAIEFDSI